MKQSTVFQDLKTIATRRGKLAVNKVENFIIDNLKEIYTQYGEESEKEKASSLASRFVDYDNSHYCPSMKIFNRLIGQFQICLAERFILLLKNEFEKHLTNQSEYEKKYDTLKAMVLNYGLCMELHRSFRLDEKMLFHCLFPQKIKLEKDNSQHYLYFSYICENSLLLRLHMLPVVDALKSVSPMFDTEFRIVMQSEDFEYQTLKRKKANLDCLKENFLNVAVMLENLKIKHANIENEFYVAFRDIEVPLLQALIEREQNKIAFDIVDKRMESKQPVSAHEMAVILTEAKCMVENSMRQDLEKLDKIQAAECFPLPDGSESKRISEEERRQIEKNVKSILRLIYKFHPDAIMRLQDYKQVSEAKKVRIKELWDKAMAIKDNRKYVSEVGFKRGHFYYDVRSASILQSIYNELCELMENEHFPKHAINYSLCFHGKTLADYYNFLDDETNIYEHMISLIRADYFTLTNDINVQTKSKILLNPEMKSNYIQDTKDKLQSIDAENKRMKRFFESLGRLS
jgi:hypothetical protein